VFLLMFLLLPCPSWMLMLQCMLVSECYSQFVAIFYAYCRATLWEAMATLRQQLCQRFCRRCVICGCNSQLPSLGNLLATSLQPMSGFSTLFSTQWLIRNSQHSSECFKPCSFVPKAGS